MGPRPTVTVDTWAPILMSCVRQRKKKDLPSKTPSRNSRHTAWKMAFLPNLRSKKLKTKQMLLCKKRLNSLTRRLNQTNRSFSTTFSLTLRVSVSMKMASTGTRIRNSLQNLPLRDCKHNKPQHCYDRHMHKNYVAFVRHSSRSYMPMCSGCYVKSA